MLAKAGHEQWESAEAAFRQAISLAGKEPVAWLALVDFLMGSNQREKAAAVIKEAERTLPPDQRFITLALSYAIIGEREKAAEQFRAALKAQPGNVPALRSFASFLVRAGEQREAQPLLRQLLDPALKAPAEEVRLGRRILAVSLAHDGNPRQVQEALALIDANLSSGAPSDRDQQTKVLLLARQPGRRAEAIRLMEEKLRDATATPQEQLVLARLYDEDKQWPASQRTLLQLVASSRDDPFYLTFAAGALLQHNEPDMARQLIDRLEGREPNSLRTLELRARWLKLKGRSAEGVAPLEAYVRSNPSDRITVAGLIELLSPREGSPNAEAAYRAIANQPEHPEGVLMLAEYHARHGRLDKALDLCERAWQTLPAELVAQTCLVSLNSARPKITDAQMQRVAHWLDGAIERSPRMVALRIDQALVRTLQGRDDETATIYREILDGLDPSNTFCLNNLAFLLAVKFASGDAALKLIDQAIASSGPFPLLLDTRAVALMTLGRGHEAIRDLETAIAQGAGPSTARSLYFHLAQASLLEKDRTAAKNAFVLAAQVGLRAENVDPHERAGYDRLVGELRTNE